MSANAEGLSTIAEQLRLRKPRRNKDPIWETVADLNPTPPPSAFQSTRSKPSVCNSIKTSKIVTLRGLGCTASAQVSVPEAIRTSADWHGKEGRNKKLRGGLRHLKKLNSHKHNEGPVMAIEDNPSVLPDVWCVPGVGITSSAASVDCVVSRKAVVPSSGRDKVDVDKINSREKERSCNGRRTLNVDEHMPLLSSESMFGRRRLESDIFGARYYRQFRHSSPQGLAEIALFRGSLPMGGRPYDYDRFRDWRLDVDTMSYEELLQLGDRIGYVNTGLREDEMNHCLRRTKLLILNDYLSTEIELKCSICQEEYGEDDEMEKLDCGHLYHTDCIKQWLAHKNICPVCKSVAAADADKKRD